MLFRTFAIHITLGLKMNGRVRLLILLVAAVIGGCSWITTFAVVNTSAAPITISYVIASFGTKVPPCPDDQFGTVPRIVPKEALESLAGLKQEAPPAQFSCDAATRKVTLTIASNHAVSLFRAGNYGGPNSERDHILELSTLEIKGEHGELHYSGRQILRDFEKRSVALWVLSYK